MKKIKVKVSARHIHLSLKDLKALFGPDYKLKKLKSLSQPQDFAALETVKIRNKDKFIEKVRVVGPTRKNTQLELSMTDCFRLGIRPELRLSGDIKGSPGLNISGPFGSINLKQGAIVAKRHIHASPAEAKELKLKDKSIVSVIIKGKRSLTFNNVIVRVSDNYRLCMHIDTDEGNAAGINKTSFGFIL
ncbi:MAG: phosphate propanoyltransferase [Candidatus Pacebacteria bacterium]|nr:phosphate propanoyltransferase [Candidatus Paceibacterota bacterium]